nr:MAG TPA: hypothetical protein [Caudoviricetes sp.]
MVNFVNHLFNLFVDFLMFLVYFTKQIVYNVVER